MTSELKSQSGSAVRSTDLLGLSSNTEKSGFNAHDKTEGKEEWLTPPEIISALGGFDLDPCAPAGGWGEPDLKQCKWEAERAVMILKHANNPIALNLAVHHLEEAIKALRPARPNAAMSDCAGGKLNS